MIRAAVHPNGEVLAVVEAKKQVRDPNVAREQARHYITEIAKVAPPDLSQDRGA